MPNPPKRILVVEDEADVRELMLMHLKREGIEAEGVDNGEEALRRFRERSFDLAVLDWMLPGLSGLEICKSLRYGSNTPRIPILMVTARAESADIVRGLESGADDYITKPFDLPVFLARVRALLRRVSEEETPKAGERPGLIRIRDLSLDPEAHKVFCGSSELHLTPSEFKLLHALMQHQGRVLSRERLIELVQGEGVVVVDRAIDTHVFGLRKKLGPCSEVIETIRGVGYRIDG